MRKPDPMGAVHQRIEYAKSLDDVTASAHGASPAAASRSREVEFDVCKHIQHRIFACIDAHAEELEANGVTELSLAYREEADWLDDLRSRLQPAAAVERASREDVSTNPSRAERHVVVPVEPTPEMERAAFEEMTSLPESECVTGGGLIEIFRSGYRGALSVLSAAPPVQMEAVIERDEAERIVDALFKDLRDRKFLKWLFSEDPEAMGPILHDSHGQPLNALSADVQDEIRETWIGILLSKPDDMKEGAPEPFVTTEEYNATYGSDPIKEPPA